MSLIGTVGRSSPLGSRRCSTRSTGSVHRETAGIGTGGLMLAENDADSIPHGSLVGHAVTEPGRAHSS